MKQSILEHAWLRRGLSIIASGVLAATLAVSTTPASAFASAEDAAQSWSDAIEASESADYSAYSSTVDGVATASDTFPDKFDLRDKGVVTPVKQQSPLNTCWAHAAIAAAETSILYELSATGATYDASQFDLSERYLAWFTYFAVPESYSGSAQAGEGYDMSTSTQTPASVLQRGGYAQYASTLFSAGVGPVSESVAPYKNDNDIMVCNVVEPNAAEDAQAKQQDLSQEEIDALREQGYTVTPLYYAFDQRDSRTTSWGLDASLYGQSEYTLEESYKLPDIPTFNRFGGYVGPSQEGIAAVKTQLMRGRAVAMGSLVDQATVEKWAKYINLDTWAVWANYTIKGTNGGDLHATTIVGWDDTFSKDNFRKIDGESPAGDGAWLVKNSWGASTNDFPNNGDWGIVDENGNNTGYFWISYYDETIEGLEAFNFDVNSETSNEKFDCDQYNFLMISDSTLTNSSDQKMSIANEFTASTNRVIRALTCETAKPNTDVTYEVYLLSSDDANPTDGELVLTKTANYDYGGYHRLMLGEADQIAMREGQRYSVVITQKCVTDGKYYQVVARADSSVYSSLGGSVVQKLNSKESWVFYNDEWVDWKTVSGIATLDTNYIVDNFPIKALSQEHDWASIEELSELEAAIANVKAALAAAKISVDGSDVAASDTWMTQEQYKDLAAAVADAEIQLKLAGDYKNTLEKTTPTSGEVTEALSALSFDDQHGTKGDSGDDSKKDEGKGDSGEGSGSGSSDNQGSADEPAKTVKANNANGFAQTGDTAVAGAVALMGIAAFSLVAISALRRRKQG